MSRRLTPEMNTCLHWLYPIWVSIPLSQCPDVYKLWIETIDIDWPSFPHKSYQFWVVSSSHVFSISFWHNETGDVSCSIGRGHERRRYGPKEQAIFDFFGRLNQAKTLIGCGFLLFDVCKTKSCCTLCVCVVVSRCFFVSFSPRGRCRLVARLLPDRSRFRGCSAAVPRKTCLQDFAQDGTMAQRTTWLVLLLRSSRSWHVCLHVFFQYPLLTGFVFLL